MQIAMPPKHSFTATLPARSVLLSSVAVSLIVACSQAAYCAPVESVNEGASVKIEEAAGGKAKRPAASETPAEKKEVELQELTLNDIQDVGILLRHVKQQAINIYEEAARTKIGLNSSPDIPEIHTIPIQAHAKNVLLPPRTEYLVFFLATMEPIIRQLNKEVGEVEAGTGRLVLPPSVDKYLEPMWTNWKMNIKDMNTHLDELVPLFDNAGHNNAKIQALAVNIFNDVHRLEGLRKDVFRVVQYMEKKAPDEKIMMPPG